MISQSNSLYDYIIEDAKFFNEFDKSNFINTASSVLNNTDVKVQLNKANHYLKSLEDAISHINNVVLNYDWQEISEFIDKVLGSGRIDSAKISIKDITKNDNIILKPQYLAEAVLNYKEVINGIASGKYDINNIKSIYTNIDSYMSTLRKRLVSSSINHNITHSDMLNYENTDYTVINTKYLSNIILPFLQDFQKNKKDIINDLTNVYSVVKETIDDLNKVNDNINIGIENGKLTAEQQKLILNYTYNQTRAIMDSISFIVYAVNKKAHQFKDSIIQCQNLYESLTLVFHDSMNVVEAGAFDNKVITAPDALNIAEKLVEGQNDIFVELSHNIIEYHKGYIATNNSNDVDIPSGDMEDYVSTLLSNHEFNNKLYNDLVKIYIEIGNGFDILARNFDDRLIIFDDILQKSGFSLVLMDRFCNTIESIDDLSQYNITNLEIGDNINKQETYYTILSEITAYPELTKQIANAASTIQKKSEYVEDLITARKNGELAYSETLNELKIFMDSFKDQYRQLNTTIVKGLYMRLKKLAVKADECIDNVNPAFDNSDYEIDFFKEAVIANLQEENNITDIVMETLLKEYYSEREYNERGVHLVYEADESTTVKVTDNSGNTTPSTGSTSENNTGIKAKMSDLLKSITEWFTNMINKFNEVIGRQKAKNTKWLSENKDGLLNRSYSNVEIQILPYDKMPSNQVITDISKLATNVSAMTPQNMQNINSYEDARNKLINFGPKFTKDDEKVTIRNYYKVGNMPLQTVKYSNNEIKNIITNNMIPYCEAFYDSYSAEVTKQLNTLKNNLENIHKSYVSESVSNIFDCDIYTEADNNTDPNKSSNSANISDKNGWIKKCVQMYSGCVLNSIRDRNNDYFKVLYALAPKKAPVNNTKPQQTQDQTKK